MRILTSAVILLAAVTIPGVQAQETPAAKTQQAPAAKAAAAKKQSAAVAKPAAKPAGTAPAKGAGVSTLKTPKQKFSYALGMNLGTSLHRQAVDVDPALVAQGMRAAIAGGKTLLTQEEAQAAMMETQNEVRKKQQETMQAASQANKKVGDAFLAANKAKEGVVTLPSGLEYKILKEGTGPKPTAADTVVCNYKGTLLDGKEFDSSYKRGQPATFAVGGVIKGWTEALQLMPVGSKWQLFIPASLAYGDRGAGQDIAPGSTLIFEVELMSIQEKAKAEEKPKVEMKPESEEKK